MASREMVTVESDLEVQMRKKGEGPFLKNRLNELFFSPLDIYMFWGTCPQPFSGLPGPTAPESHGLALPVTRPDWGGAAYSPVTCLRRRQARLNCPLGIRIKRQQQFPVWCG